MTKYQGTERDRERSRKSVAKWREEHKEVWLARAKTYRKNEKAKDPEAFNAKNRVRARKFESRARDYVKEVKAAGACVVCGERNPTVLQFHHLRDKKFTIGHGRRSIKTLREEMEKCVLMCANCHIRLHAGEVTITQ